MRKVWAMLIGGFCFVAVGLPASAQRQDAVTLGSVVVGEMTTKATVVAIDYQKRILTFRDPEGKTRTFRADKNVLNFDQIKIGDQVTTELTESVAIFVERHEGNTKPEEIAVTQVAPDGKEQRVVRVETHQVKARVEAIDYGRRTLTLRWQEGNTVTFTVDKGVMAFDQVKTGEEVVVRFTETVVVSVQKAKE